MTRNGKIARLPRAIREQINLRLQNGGEGKQIVAWLNTIPEVMRLVAAEFDGQPVSEMNLSNWKLGGYREWETLQESVEVVRGFGADAAELRQAGGLELTDQVALYLAARLAVALRKLPGDDHTPGQLRQWCADLVALRKGDHRAQWLRVARQKVDLERRKFDHKTAAERKKAKALLNPKEGGVSKEMFDRVASELRLL